MKNLVLTANKVATIKKGLIDSLTIASGSKSSATYYHSKEEQARAIKQNVANLYDLSKELPLIVATQKGVTGKFIHEVLLNEFKNTLNGGACNIVNPIDWYDNGIGEKAVLSALYNLNDNGIPYVLRLFVEMKTERINNERARKIILGFLLGHPNLEFNSLKYRNKIAEVLQHVYGIKMTSILLGIAKDVVRSNGVYTSEQSINIAKDNFLKYVSVGDIKAFKTLLFIFKQDSGIRYLKRDFPVIYEYQKAKTDVTSATKVPEEVLIGLISNRNHPQYQDLWSTEAKRKTTMATFRTRTEVTSVNQQVRQTKSTAKLGVQKQVNLNKATDFMALYKTGYENGWTDELKAAIDNLAEKKKFNNFMYKNVGIILDDSNSMTGHKRESKNTPKAIANFTARVLRKSAQSAVIVKTDGEATDLASSFVELLKMEGSVSYDAIFILTDGYENTYDGLMNEVLSIYFAETDRNLPVFQISPVTGAETGGNVRKLGQNVVTMSVNDPVAIQPQINSRLLEIDTARWLKNQVLALEEAQVTRKVKNNVNV